MMAQRSLPVQQDRVKAVRPLLLVKRFDTAHTVLLRQQFRRSKFQILASKFVTYGLLGVAMPELLSSLVGRGEHMQQEKPLQEQRLSACQAFRCVALLGCNSDECTCLESKQSCIRGACNVCADLWYSRHFGGERRNVTSRQLERISSADTLESLTLFFRSYRG